MGANIPPMEITTLGVFFPPRLQKEHNLRYLELVPSMGDVHDVDCNNSDRKIEWSVLRRLCHIAFSPRLDSFISRIGHSPFADKIESLIQLEDRGFALFLAMTTKDPACMTESSRLPAVYYLACDCPKLRLLAKILQDAGVFSTTGTRPRFVVFLQWPLIMWLTEMFIDALSLPYTVIRSSMSMKERVAAANYFTDPNSDCVVLLTEYNYVTPDLNLHKACSRAILLEPPLDMSVVLQAVGRLHCQGQTHPQKATVLFSQSTISRYIESENMRKILPLVTAHLRSESQNSSETDANINGDSQAMARRADGFAEVELAKPLGQDESHLPYGDPDDLGYY
ncbi:hypothetical protein BO71DRAFT_326603 [Aspergillus ellipticus CBS 707.79]|uniref:Helicase C-terminal domain-containing protein n=1 Tax=Aspergillus ellipticus CBS 707.79 TaxID=1448320 RepID=A0A319ESA2_9EURO|nr:hypothetical protein BO71DRAFT_326603 [Aspergillus ellipticus CBS 707.79]